MSEPSKAEMDIIDEKVKGFISELLQNHLVSIRVFVTKTEAAQAKSYDSGGGDWYSTYGAIREWIIKQDERAKDSVKRECEAASSGSDDMYDFGPM